MSQRGRRNADEALQAALVGGAKVQDAAEMAGVSEATAYRRLQDPEFSESLRQAKADLVDRTASMLTSAAVQAVQTLMDLQKADVSAAVRLGAARSVIELGSRLRDSVEFEARLAALEAQAQGGHQDHLAPVV
jgi:hypothetical protein